MQQNKNPFPISLHNTHVKLLAFDLLTLTPPISPNHSFTRNSISITRAETVGTITLRDHKPFKFLRFAIDDGTGCIPCILWLNHMTSPHLARRRSPQDLCLLADAAARSAEVVKIGNVARVRGRVTEYKGGVQITVTDVISERDPNVEVLHWVECVNLARNCYNLVNVSSSSGSVVPKLN
ncbi:OB-fold nucleic acid-binding domain protein [Medicago truncatula]|uniref:CST complex subunit STN1 n=1 Tax=Medicago truncatula TaxID=3880 RepID=A0A072VGF3_MEDTR|nr:OB-fold nucleic acid-binding domain protein [Medicago truncatula]